MEDVPQGGRPQKIVTNLHITMTSNFKGTIIQAGTDEDGQPRLSIIVNETDLKAMPMIPLYRNVEILVRWPDTSPAEQAAEALPEIMP